MSNQFIVRSRNSFSIILSQSESSEESVTKKRSLVFAETHDSNDDWTYKFVESMVPFDLKTPSGIQKFARVLVSALK